MPTTKFTRALAAVLSSAVCFGAVLAGAMPAAPAHAQASAASPKKVIVIFKDGRKLEGELLSETDSAIKLRVVIAGIRAETEYSRAEIKEITVVDEGTPAAPATPQPRTPAPTTTPSTTPSAPAAPAPPGSGTPTGAELAGLIEESDLAFGDQKWRISSRAIESEANGPKVYVIHMGGKFGRDVSYTPMEEIVRDMKRYEPDVVVCFYNHPIAGFTFAQNPNAFYELDTARTISALLAERLRDQSEFPKQPRVVSWVRRALDSAAFMPFTAKELYYTSDALHGGIGFLEKLMDGIGDERTREKQYSLLMARAEGLLVEGGHNPLIMRSMCRTDFVCSVRFENGVPVLLPNAYPSSPDEILLTDDGKDDRKDTAADMVRHRGNDVLTLDAEMAFRLEVSRGTADTLDDLMDRMGLPRNYIVIRGRSAQIFRDWSRAVTNAEDQFARMWRQFDDVRVRPPGDYSARTRARGERKQILNKIKALLQRYQEAINPREIQGAPDDWINQIDIMIQTIDAQQLADRPERR